MLVACLILAAPFWDPLVTLYVDDGTPNVAESKERTDIVKLMTSVVSKDLLGFLGKLEEPTPEEVTFMPLLKDKIEKEEEPFKEFAAQKALLHRGLFKVTPGGVWKAFFREVTGTNAIERLAYIQNKTEVLQSGILKTDNRSRRFVYDESGRLRAASFSYYVEAGGMVAEFDRLWLLNWTNKAKPKVAEVWLAESLDRREWRLSRWTSSD